MARKWARRGEGVCHLPLAGPLCYPETRATQARHPREVLMATVTPKPRAAETISPQALREAIRFHERYSVGKSGREVNHAESLTALGLAVRDQLVERMHATEDRYRAADAKRVYYLSMEFLIGRSLRNNLINLGIYETCRDILKEINVDVRVIE